MANEALDSEVAARQRGRLVPVIAVLALIAGYVLSTGPVAFVLAYFDLDTSPVGHVVEAAYYPLTAMYHWDETSTYSQLFEKWIDFWLRLSGRFPGP